LTGRLPAVNKRLLLALAFLCLYPLLLLLRNFDDNTLVSWNWAVVGRDTAVIFLLQAFGVAAAYYLSRFPLPRRPLSLVLFLMIPVSLSLFLWGIPEVVIDSSRYFTQAKHLEIYGFSHFAAEWGSGIDAWTDLPLSSFLYGTLFRFAGESRVAVQLLNTAMFASTVLLTSMIGRLLWGVEAGFLAGLLLTGSPYLLTQVPLMLSDVTAMFFLTLSVYLTLAYTRRGGGLRLFLSGIGISGALLAKYSLWPALFLMMAVIPAVELFSSRDREVLRRAGALALTAAAVVSALFLWKGGLMLSQMGLLMDYQLSGLRRWGESHVSTFVFQVHPFLVILAGYGAWCAVRRKDASYLVAILLPVLAVLLQVRRTRYVMVALPLLAAAAAYGLCHVKDPRIRRFTAWSVVFFAAVTALFLYRPFLQGMSLRNLKDAAQVLNSTGQSVVEIHLSPEAGSAVNPAVAIPMLDLYTGGRIIFPYRELPDAGDRRGGSSPFRFSWRYRNPAYYADSSREKGAAAVVFIAGVPGEALPPRLEERTRGHRRADFFADNGLFNFSTQVTVLLPPEDR
jgi:4-amino-4-deoxy-L-arabinose transferase-like glycosyltransferase